MLIHFVVPGSPIAQPRQRHRIANGQGRQFVHNYTPTKHPVNAFKAAVQSAAASVYHGAPSEAPIAMDIVAVFPRAAGKVWKTKPMPSYPHTSRPDADNLAKSVMDGLTSVVWARDEQVAHLTVTKRVASGDEQPHVEVAIRTIGDEVAA